MEATADQLKALVLKQPPLDLLAYAWCGLYMRAMFSAEAEEAPSPEEEEAANQLMAALEYFHAIWSCFPDSLGSTVRLDEADAAAILDLAGELRNMAMPHSLASTSRVGCGEFGTATGQLEFHARSSWIMIRGNRYQVLEEEFFAFVLAPHDTALRDAHDTAAVAASRGPAL